MKKISESRKLLGATPATTLKELSQLYKSLMKQHHPDKFQEEALKQQAESTSQQVIEAYKFLESIHPETHAANTAEFEKTVASNITNWHYQHMTLHIVFGDGSTYDFYGVDPKTYNKFTNADGNTRFARRHIFGSFTHRKVSSATAQ